MARTPSDRYIVKALVHASEILDAFESSGEVLRLRDVVRRTGFSKGMCFRLLHTLHHCGFIEKVDELRFRHDRGDPPAQTLPDRLCGAGTEQLVRPRGACQPGRRRAALRHRADRRRQPLSAEDRPPKRRSPRPRRTSTSSSSSRPTRPSRPRSPRATSRRASRLSPSTSRTPARPTSAQTTTRPACLPDAIWAAGRRASGAARWTRFSCSSSRVPARWCVRDRAASSPASSKRSIGPRTRRSCASTATDSSRPRSSGCADISVSRRRDAFWSAPPTTRARSAPRAPSRRPAATRIARLPGRTPNRTRAPNCAIRGTSLVASVAYFPERYGDDLIRLALDILARRPVPPAVFVHHQVITAENVDQIYPNDSLLRAAPLIAQRMSPTKNAKAAKDAKHFLQRPFSALLCVLCVLDVGGRVRAQSPSSGRDKGWWDFGGGPSASKFVDLDQIKKSNVDQLQVAWFYPYALPGFNPDRRRRCDLRGRAEQRADRARRGHRQGNLDPRGLAGMTSRGVNYWESEDGTRQTAAVCDRRLSAGDRRAKAASRFAASAPTGSWTCARASARRRH